MADFIEAADRNATAPVSQNAIYFAEVGDVDRLREVLKARPELVHSSKDWAGDGLLSLAVWHDHVDVARSLIEDFDAHINSRNNYGSTPLHRACALQNLECVQLLVEKGAAISARDNVGKQPVDIAEGPVWRFMKDRMDLQKATVEAQLRAFEEADRIWDAGLEAMKEAERKATIAKRLYDAVSIVIEHANNEDINGVYDPIDDVVDEWPCYRRRQDDRTTTEIWISFEAKSSSWVIKRGEVSYAILSKPEVVLEDSYLARLRSNPPTFPELRFEGANGIEEVEVVAPSLDSNSTHDHNNNNSSSNSGSSIASNTRRQKDHHHHQQEEEGEGEGEGEEVEMTAVSRLTIVTETEWKAMRDLESMKRNAELL